MISRKRSALALLALASFAACTADDPASSAGPTFKSITANNHTCVISVEDVLYCWGNNASFQIAPLPGAVLPPTQIVGGRWAQVTAGLRHTCIADTAGNAACWGANDFGIVGAGVTYTYEVQPRYVHGEHQFRVLAAGSLHQCGVTRGNVGYCWGANHTSMIGDGTSAVRTLPTAIAGSLELRDLVAGSNHTCGLTVAGVAYCWGLNLHGEVGDGTQTDRMTPAAVAGGRTYRKLSSALAHTCGLTMAGVAYCWGVNDEGQLGDGTTDDRLVPTQVLGNFIFSDIAAGATHTCALDLDGVAYCWGFNVYGAVGDGTLSADSRLMPKAVTGGKRFRALAAYQHTCGITLEGDVYCWGRNSLGQLGDGTFGASPSPKQVVFQ